MSKLKNLLQKSSSKKKPPYQLTFLVCKPIGCRKCVYISREMHYKISQIINTITDKGITIGGYVENVLEHHLAENKEEINKLYCRNREKLV